MKYNTTDEQAARVKLFIYYYGKAGTREILDVTERQLDVASQGERSCHRLREDTIRRIVSNLDKSQHMLDNNPGKQFQEESHTEFAEMLAQVKKCQTMLAEVESFLLRGKMGFIGPDPFKMPERRRRPKPTESWVDPDFDPFQAD